MPFVCAFSHLKIVAVLTFFQQRLYMRDQKFMQFQVLDKTNLSTRMQKEPTATQTVPYIILGCSLPPEESHQDFYASQVPLRGPCLQSTKPPSEIRCGRQQSLIITFSLRCWEWPTLGEWPLHATSLLLSTNVQSALSSGLCENSRKYKKNMNQLKFICTQNVRSLIDLVETVYPRQSERQATVASTS